MKIEIFEKVLEAEKQEWERGKETDHYKEYKSYPTETKEKVKEIRKENGCPSVAILRGYFSCREWNSDKLIIEDFWASDGEDVLATLEKGNVKEFYLTETSSGLMSEIHVLTKGGWKMEAVEIIHPYFKTIDYETGKSIPEKKMAIKFFK